MNNSIKETDKQKLARLQKKVKKLENELLKYKVSKKRKDLTILNDQFSDEINLEKLKKDQ
tara:strand:- start:113 stop:292 length:180 start_codon:yes stop_codon:yes gene_type:complete